MMLQLNYIVVAVVCVVVVVNVVALLVVTFFCLNIVFQPLCTYNLV